MLDPARPYNELPLLPPQGELETKPVLKRCIAARAALAELRAAALLLPNPSILTRSFLLLEAKDSSEIENIVTTNDALFRAASLDLESADPATKEAISYRNALFHGSRTLSQRPITTRTAVDICRAVTNIDLDVRRTTGTALRSSHTGDVIYTPPEGEQRIRDLLSNWEKFINEPSELDPLTRMAVQHYQFEAIHPFPDGNGRTGRILNILSLVQDKLLDQPILYLSRHILRTRSEYYSLLNRVSTHQDWEAWLDYILLAVEVTARWTRDKIAAIRRLMDETSAHIRRHHPKIYSRELLDLLFELPYCRIANVVDHGIAKRQTAAQYLSALAAIGVVNEIKYGRDKLFVNWKYSDLLENDDHEFEPFGTPAKI